MGVVRSIVVGVLLSWIAMKVYLGLVSHGVGIHYSNQLPGNCSVIPGIECGSEDIAITQNGLAFVTSGLRLFTKCPGYEGRIYLLDVRSPHEPIVHLEIVSSTLTPSGFEPHGLSHFEQDNQISLFVVNHGSNQETIEVFVYDSAHQKLIHQQSISHPLFLCLNSLVAVGNNEFYITNWLIYCPSQHFTLIALESLLSFRYGYVIHYVDGAASIVAPDLRVPNGIAVSRDQTEVYVAVDGKSVVAVYLRTQDGGLTLRQHIPVPGGLDNLFVDPISGDIYVATIPKPLLLMSGEYNATSHYPPAQVHRIRYDPKTKSYDVQQVLYSDGKNFARGATVGAVYKKTLLVGTLWHKLGICDGLP